MRKIRMPVTASTTAPGYRNPNGQVVVRDTGFPSDTFPGQRVYRLRCGGCEHHYGANGCDVFRRLCPKCQGGTKGETLREEGLRLFE